MDTRELDARVAREVMSWPESICATVSEGTSPWLPSSDIKAAMQVVAKMRERGCSFMLDLDSEGKWAASFCPNGFHPQAEADTPAHAICLAALEAVAGKNKE